MNKIASISILSLIHPIQVFADPADASALSSTLASSPVNLASVSQVFAALLIIIVIILGGAWLYKRSGLLNGTSGSSIKVISALSLGGKEKAVLLQVGKEQILVGVTPGHIRKLHSLSEPVVVEAVPDTDSFISKLQNEINKVIKK